MNRDYLAQQLDDVWWAPPVAALLCLVQVAITEAARLCFTFHERGQADQMPWAVGAAQGSAERGNRDPGRRIDWPSLRARSEMGMGKEAVQRGLL